VLVFSEEKEPNVAISKGKRLELQHFRRENNAILVFSKGKVHNVGIFKGKGVEF